MFADRLPESSRKAAWASSYEGYQMLWKQQQQHVEKMPLHFQGELLAGLAQSSQRTGRDEELAKFLEMILKVLPDTPYARTAQKWKDDPQAAATGMIACKSCPPTGVDWRSALVRKVRNETAFPAERFERRTDFHEDMAK